MENKDILKSHPGSNLRLVIPVGCTVTSDRLYLWSNVSNAAGASCTDG